MDIDRFVEFFLGFTMVCQIIVVGCLIVLFVLLVRWTHDR
jgi:hypothetical protein